jgi:hypothetical protein
MFYFCIFLVINMQESIFVIKNLTRSTPLGKLSSTPSSLKGVGKVYKNQHN